MQRLGPLATTHTVWSEARIHRPALDSTSINGFEIYREDIPITQALAVAARNFSLDRGEISALSLMEKKAGKLFLCDDAAARVAAVAMGFEVRGTIGLLVRASALGIRSKEEISSLLADIPNRSTLHLSGDLLRRVLGSLDK